MANPYGWYHQAVLDDLFLKAWATAYIKHILDTGLLDYIGLTNKKEQEHFKANMDKYLHKVDKVCLDRSNTLPTGILNKAQMVTRHMSHKVAWLRSGLLWKDADIMLPRCPW